MQVLLCLIPIFLLIAIIWWDWKHTTDEDNEGYEENPNKPYKK
jgi:hypothetical protein